MYKFFQLLIFTFLFSIAAFSHNLDMKALKLRTWNISNHKSVKASFLMMKENEVYLEKEKSETIHFPISDFCAEDQNFIRKETEKIQHLNTPIITAAETTIPPSINYIKIAMVGLILLVIWGLAFYFRQRIPLAYSNLFLLVGFAAIGYSFSANYLRRINSTTNPLTVDSAFVPFKPNVVTRWDNTYFYVESKGIPTTHAMMTGITGWQQQVPIPQCYIGNNAWSIPLNPVVAATPVPVNAAHFSRGAIAVAVNGVAIFNPYTNTGVDAFLDGQLDNWGGHCGRADDYHYHTAPLHLYGTTSQRLPIAYGLDGFAVYGSQEPDGSAMKALDANHGHYGSNGVYHYHGSAAAPYMIGNMVGQITEDTTHQIIPQASATPVRPSLTPLKGAVITSCTPNGNNGYILSYTLSGQNYQVSYNWTSNGLYTFNFINPSGTTTNTYNGFKPCTLTQGIRENTAKDKNLLWYPNPAHQEIMFSGDKINKEEFKSIQIYSATGQLVLNSNAFPEKINTNNFTKGIYVIVINTTNGKYADKIVID